MAELVSLAERHLASAQALLGSAQGPQATVNAAMMRIRSLDARAASLGPGAALEELCDGRFAAASEAHAALGVAISKLDDLLRAMERELAAEACGALGLPQQQYAIAMHAAVRRAASAEQQPAAVAGGRGAGGQRQAKPRGRGSVAAGAGGGGGGGTNGGGRGGGGNSAAARRATVEGAPAQGTVAVAPAAGNGHIVSMDALYGARPAAAGGGAAVAAGGADAAPVAPPFAFAAAQAQRAANNAMGAQAQVAAWGGAVGGGAARQGAVGGGLSATVAEETYCLCGGISYGEMVACEDPTCKIEWFHYPCVGLASGTTPPDKWYCPVCAQQHRPVKRAKKNRA